MSSVSFGPLADALLVAFPETITYVPRVGATREISCVVDRHPVEVVPSTPGAVAPFARVYPKNDATEGISAEELDTGGDAVQFPERLGGATDRTWSIARMAQHDDGMLELEVR